MEQHMGNNVNQERDALELLMRLRQGKANVNQVRDSLEYNVGIYSEKIIELKESLQKAEDRHRMWSIKLQVFDLKEEDAVKNQPLIERLEKVLILENLVV
jgi:capsule polysaccharide export protein KpsE/RkpR